MLPDGPRQPLRATLAGTPGDRRRNRLPAQSCAACGHDDTRVTLRTDYVVYFRCERCAAVWNLPKPGRQTQFGT
jgi:hypothetical protein